ncbi:hypothetical protein GCM10023187_46600 [Nibrella viscosa]|uniref:Uncharacterized protein n=1 Tax=Nibrella viscosa TaxID=1084524 RepID=A0ABP8KTS5_9BACT
MTLDQFTASLADAQPPAGLHPILNALWYDGRGDWDRAHETAQSREGVREYDRLHAYLHRKEGDQWNAGYWYRRAGAPVFDGSLADEWTELVQHYLP